MASRTDMGTSSKGPGSARSSAAAGSSADPAPGVVLDVALKRLVQGLTPTPQAWSWRQSLVNDHISRLQQYWRTDHQIRILPFGSSLSGLCLADSDIDIGLFGYMHQVELEAVTSAQAKKLLYNVLSGIHRAHLADGKVQCVMGARVPVLKYKCALSGLDCDISIQGSGALLKANFISILTHHCPVLSPLYRLVKLWAAAHDINDASRSTFNSTSLLYLTVFFLQTQQLAPSFKELVDAALLNDPARRLLCAPNKWLWDRPEHLQALLDAAQGRMKVWVHAQQRQGRAWGQHSLGQLLQGFFAFYAELFTDWVLGKRRSVYADLWEGQLSSHHDRGEQLGKDYLFNLQDPFDPVDCPARAIGTMNNTNNGVGVLITYFIACSCSALERYLHPSSSSTDPNHSSSSNSSSLQQRLCQCLAWLFGPQGVLHMVAGGNSSSGGGSSSAHWQEWATCPFDLQLVVKLQARQQQQHQQKQHSSAHGRGARGRAESPAAQFKWLVTSLQADVDPGSGPGAQYGACVLCLEHLQLFNKRVEAGLLSGTLGAALAADAVTRRAMQQQNWQQLDAVRRQWQKQRLLGPPLPQQDEKIGLIWGQLMAVLNGQGWQPKEGGKRRSPAAHPKAVKVAAREAVSKVALRMLELGSSDSQRQHQQQPPQGVAGRLNGFQDPELAVDAFSDKPAAAAAAEGEAHGAEGIGGFGLQAVLEQHGFMPVFERWGFVDGEGDIWGKLLPLPEHLKQQRGGSSASSAAAAAAAAGSSVAGTAAGHGARAGKRAQVRMHYIQKDLLVAGQAASSSLQEQEQRGQHHHPHHHHHHHHHHPDHHQPQQGDGALQFDLDMQTHSVSAGFDGSSSCTVSGLVQDLQHVTVGAGVTTQKAAAAAAAGAQHGSALQPGMAQHGQQGAVCHRAELVGSPGIAVASIRSSPGLYGSPAAAATAAGAGSPGMASPPNGKAHALQPKGHGKQQQQQGHEGGAAADAVSVRMGPRKQQLGRRQFGRSPEVAVASVPIDMEPGGGHVLATHGDGLADSYCRQLQEKISSPVQVWQQQQQRQEIRHPAAILLGSTAVQLATAGSSGSSSMALSPPTAAAAGGSSSSSNLSPLANKPQLRVRQAAYKVKQLEQQICKAEGQIAAKEAEVAQYQQQLQQLCKSVGGDIGESMLAAADRRALMDAKNGLLSSEKALKAQRVNLETASRKLPDAQRELQAAAAAAAAIASPGQCIALT